MSDRDEEIDAIKALAQVVPVEHSTQETQLAADVARYLNEREQLRQQTDQGE